jgi:hypothetical protein
MLTLSEVNQIAEKAAAAALKRVGISRVVTEPTVDSDGNDAFKVLVVFKRGMTETITGAEGLRTIVKINQDLEKAGDDRLPIIEFATEEELELELNGESED